MVTYTDASISNLHFRLFVDGDDAPLDLSLDNFTVTGTGSFDNIPVLSIEAVNSNGDTVQVVGLTDSDGFLIKRLDLINYDAQFNEFAGGRVQITNDNNTGGNIYIKVKEDVYKYAKSSLPLDSEDGTTAVVSKLSVIPETSAKAFSFNNYSKAGLCYVEYDDDLEGLYLKTMGISTVSGTDYSAPLDLSSSSYPFAWDPNNNTVFYYVDGCIDELRLLSDRLTFLGKLPTKYPCLRYCYHLISHVTTRSQSLHGNVHVQPKLQFAVVLD
jgi:hypothetical protein